jgi:hypothetical protein
MYIYDHSSLNSSYNEKFFRAVYKIIAHFVSNTFLKKSCLLLDNVEKYGRTRQAADDNIVRRRKHAIYLPDN